MIINGLSPAGDWQFGLGQGNYLTDNAAIGLNIKTRLMSWVGDCFFDQTAGIDWLNRLDKGQEALLEMDLRRIILLSNGVVGINSFSFQLNGRAFSATFNINTVYSAAYISSLKQDI